MQTTLKRISAFFCAVFSISPTLAADDVAAITTQEHQLEAAYLSGDADVMRAILREDFIFTHGSGSVVNRDKTIASFKKNGKFKSRESVVFDVELHGDTAISLGKTLVQPKNGDDYTVCYFRLYQRGSAGWQLVSHRTHREAHNLTETCTPR